MKRKGRIILSCSLLAAIILAPVVWFFWPRYHYTPTGDELYDRCAELVLEQYYEQQPEVNWQRLVGWIKSRSQQPVHPWYVIDWSEALTWEDEFGDDVRYWQLLYALSLIDLAERFTIDPNSALRAREQCLLSLIEEGVFDVGSFQYVPWGNTVMADEAGAFDLIETAIEIDPGNAYFDYVKADMLMVLGEIDQAWELIRQGNTAPQCRIPVGFPHQVFFDNASRSMSASNMLADTLIYTEVWNLPNYIKVKERYVEASVCIALGYPIELADDFILRSCRMGQAENVDTIGQAVSQICAQVLIDYACEECIVMDKNALEEKLALDEELYGIYDTRQDSALSWSVIYPSNADSLESMRSWTVHPWNYLTHSQLLLLRKDILAAQESVDENKSLFDCLDPPPLARWARGEAAEE